MSMYTDEWLRGFLKSNLSDRAKLVGLIQSQAADWDTGRNCFLSAQTIAERLRKSPRTVERALVELEENGWIKRTGTHRPNNVTDYCLTFGSDKAVGSGSDNGVGSDFNRFRQIGQSVPTDWAIGSDTLVGQPPLTSSDQEEEEEEEGFAPPPHSGDAPPEVTPLPTVDRVQLIAVVEGQLRDQWPQHFGRRTRITGKARTHLYALYDAGWSVDQLLAYTATLPTPKSNPAGLLAKHFARGLDEEDREDYSTVDTDAAGLQWEDEDDNDLMLPTRCAHGYSLTILEANLATCLDCHQNGSPMLTLTDAS